MLPPHRTRRLSTAALRGRFARWAALWLWAGGLLAGCPSQTPRSPGPAYAVRAIGMSDPRGKTHRLVVVPGQLRYVPPGVVVPYRGGALRPPRRSGVAWLDRGRVVGLDLTDLTVGEARRWVRRHPRVRWVHWGRLPGLTPAVVQVLRGLRSPDLTLSLGLSVAAAQDLDVRALVPLCARLAGLRLQGPVSTRGLDGLRRCRRLRALVLRGALSPRGLPAVARLEQIRHLDLAGTLRLFGPGPEGIAPLGRMRGLVSLDLSANGLRDSDLAPLARLGHLHWLGLAGNPLTGVGLGRLARLPRLAYLDLSETRLGPKGLARLSALRALRWLRLHGTRLRPAALRVFARARPTVRILARSVPREPAVGGGWGAWEPVAAPAEAPRPAASAPPARRPAPRPRPFVLPRPRATGIPSCDRFLRSYHCVMLFIARGSPKVARANMGQMGRFLRRIRRMTRSAAQALCRKMQRRIGGLLRSKTLRHCLKP